MKNLPRACLLLLLALPLTAAAAEREWIPYRKLADTLKLEKFYGLPPAERDKVQLYALFKPTNPAIAVGDVRLAVLHGGARYPLPIDAHGHVLVPLNPQWLADDAKIWTSMPSGEKMSMRFDIGAVLPEGTQWNYASVMGSVPQANAAIGKVAGALSMFVPKMKSVIFKFDKPAQLAIKARGGDKRYATDAKHQVRLVLDEALLKENPPVTLSERPSEAEIDGE